MKPLPFLFSLLLLFNCTTKEVRNPVTQKAESQSQKPAPEQNQKAVANTQQTPPANAGKWQYEKKVQPDGSTVSKATITASNILEFKFPYNGGSTATLTIRQRTSGTTTYLEVSKGHFNRSFQNGTATVRFDQKPPVTYSLIAAENGRANIVFFDNEQILIRQMKSAKNMAINVGFDGQGTQQIKFSIAGLKWP